MKTRANQTQEATSAQKATAARDGAVVSAVAANERAATTKQRSAKQPNALLAALDRVITKIVATTEKTVAKPIADLNQRNAHGQTPLLSALSAKDLQAAHKLIEAGAEVNATDAIGFTALHAIVKMYEEYVHDGRQQEVFRLINQLANKGIAFGRQDRRGNTAIMMVAQRATIRPSKGTAELYTNLGKLLLRLDKNASETVELRNNMGKGTLDYLAKVGNRPLWNAVHDKLVRAGNGMKSEAASVEAKWQKLAALDKEMVG